MYVNYLYIFVSHTCFYIQLILAMLYGILGWAGTPLPWCTATTFWNGLEECLGSRNRIWCSTLGQWSKVLLCCLVLIFFNLMDSPNKVWQFKITKIKLSHSFAVMIFVYLFQGNVCWLRIWLRDNCIQEHCRANGFSCFE